MNEAKYGVFLKNCTGWGRCYLGKRASVTWTDVFSVFFLFRYCSKPKCHLSSKIGCVFLHIFRWILVCRLVGLRIVVNSFAIFFCSLMPKQRARLHLGRLPGNPEVVIGLYIGAMVYCSHPPNMVCASSW